MNKKHTKTLSAMIIVPLLLVPTACATREGGGSACGIEAQNVHKSSGSPGQMLGKAEYGCKGDATSIKASVRLQYKSGGQWFTSNSWRSETKSNPTNDKSYVIQTWSMDCTKGTFRTQATISSRDSNGNNMTGQNTQYAYSDSVTDPCK